MLDASTIIAEAEARVGISDADPAVIRQNLERLVDSINREAGLPQWAEEQMHGYLSGRTADRLEAQKWLQRHPEIGAETITAPVFLTGLPRSGTTFFQYLFDHDDRFRMIRSWQALAPSPPPAVDPESVLQRQREEGERRAKSRPAAEGFEAMHLMDDGGPEECHAFMEHSYAAAGLFNLLNVPDFFDYLTRELDFTEAYRVHKRQLQLLQWQMPPLRWALKYPNHLLAMDNILDVYPDARFVMTHRDPVQTLASIAKLTYTLRSVRCDEPVDRQQVGEQLFEFVSRHIDRIMAFADGPDAGRVVHVDYYQLLNDPDTVMREVHTALGIDSPEAVRSAVAQWHRDNPKGARGANPYTLEQYGLDDAAVAARFAPYMTRFGIPREQEGLARSGQ